MTEPEVVLNLVWTGRSFDLLRPFTESLLRHTRARLRMVANWCPPEELVVLEDFATEHPDRVSDVFEASRDVMLPHGLALDVALRAHDDGELFCFLDPDIYASGPFLADFLPLLDDHHAVTSGTELWSDTNVQPREQVGVGVGGRIFYSPDGFVYGSPHLGIYRRSTLLETMGRWEVSLGSAGPELSRRALDAIDQLGVLHRVYDTGKIVNILLQADGASLVHSEHPALLHIGGLSHYVVPATYVPGPDGTPEPWWVRGAGVEARAAVASYTATVLEARRTSGIAPAIPDDTPVELVDRLELVRDALLVPDDGGSQPPGGSSGSRGPSVGVGEGVDEVFETFVAAGDYHAIDHTVQITTAGGCATTALCGYFAEHGVDLQKGPAQWPFKHARFPPEGHEVPTDFRVLYLIGDPRDAVLSLFRRQYQVGHARAMNHDWRVTRDRLREGLPVNDPDEPVLRAATVARLRTFDTFLTAGVDDFGFADHLRRWRDHPPGYPVIFVRYDHLGDHWSEVAAFLGLGNDVPDFEVQPRRSSWRSLPEHQRAMLERMYGDLVRHIESLPPVEVIG